MTCNTTSTLPPPRPRISKRRAALGALRLSTRVAGQAVVITAKATLGAACAATAATLWILAHGAPWPRRRGPIGDRTR